jgi:hypothetical protein
MATLKVKMSRLYLIKVTHLAPYLASTVCHQRSACYWDRSTPRMVRNLAQPFFQTFLSSSPIPKLPCLMLSGYFVCNSFVSPVSGLMKLLWVSQWSHYLQSETQLSPLTASKDLGQWNWSLQHSPLVPLCRCLSPGRLSKHQLVWASLSFNKLGQGCLMSLTCYRIFQLHY